LFEKGERVGAVLGRHTGRPDPLVQVGVRELDLVPEDDLGVLELVGDDAGPGVGREHARIQVDEAAECREAELAGLEDDVEGMKLLEELELRRVRLELHLPPGLVGDPV
jgi:hypothetical protein